MPFEAAKAVAATFCYNIRCALTPVFGVDFLDLCVVPEDPRFGRMVIDRNIVRHCTEAANELLVLSRDASMVASPRTPASSESFARWTPKSLRPKPIKTADVESGYGTDTDQSDKYLCSPQTPRLYEWATTNTPQHAKAQRYHLPSPKDLLSATSMPRSRDEPSEVQDTSSSGGEEGRAKRQQSELDEDYDEDSSSAPSSEELTRPRRRKKSAAMTREARAAYVLMQLSMADASLGDDAHRHKRRRASS